MSPPKPRLGAPTVIFVHIPKTAGTTVMQVLRRQYRPAATWGIPGRWWAGLEPGGARPAGPIELVYGHIQFGIDRLLPGPVRYVTVLRDPIARVASAYRDVLRQSPDLHPALPDLQRMRLEDFVTSGAVPDADNLQTRFVSGGLAHFGETGPEMLEQAKANLRDAFAAVGLLERFDESLVLFRRKLGWRAPIWYDRQNVAPAEHRTEVSSAAREAIVRHNALDMELYAFATELLDRAVAEAGAPFASELRRFRRLNPLAGVAMRARRRLRGLPPAARTT